MSDLSTPSVSIVRRSRLAPLLEGAGVFAIALVVPFLAARGQWSPADPMQPAALIYAPWTSAADAAARATSQGASLVGFGAFPFIAIVRPDSPLAVRRALTEGAWMAVDPLGTPFCAPRGSAGATLS